MTHPEQTRSEAAAAIMALVHDVLSKGDLASNQHMAYSAVDAIARHTRVLAAFDNANDVTDVATDHGA